MGFPTSRTLHHDDSRLDVDLDCGSVRQIRSKGTSKPPLAVVERRTIVWNRQRLLRMYVLHFRALSK